MTEEPSKWRQWLGRSITKALFGTNVDLSDRQTAASILAFMIVGTLCWLAVNIPDMRADIVKTLTGVIFVIIGFYFGKPHQSNDTGDDPE